MFAQPPLRLIFLSLFVYSVSFAMDNYSDDSSDDPINLKSKNKDFKKKPACDFYERKGKFNSPESIDAEFNKKLIEAAPDEIKLIILGLQDRETVLENSYLKKLLLYGDPGNGKTALAKAIALAAFGKYYYISTPSLLTKWKNCHQDLQREIDHLRQKKEPIAVIFDEMDQITNQYKNHNSSDEHMPVAFWTLLDECEIEAPFLFFIGTTNNEREDFPPQVLSRFDGNMVYIPNPNFSTCKQIMDDRLKDKQSTLTEEDKNVLLKQFEGRSCRNIIRILDQSILFSLRSNKVITYELISMAIANIPRPVSKYQHLAQMLGATEDEIRSLAANKIILEQNREVVDLFLKKKGMELQKASFNQVETHHKEDFDKRDAEIAQQAFLNLKISSINRSAQVNAGVNGGVNGGVSAGLNLGIVNFGINSGVNVGGNLGGSLTKPIVLDSDYEEIKNSLSNKQMKSLETQLIEAHARDINISEKREEQEYFSNTPSTSTFSLLVDTVKLSSQLLGKK